MTVNLLADIGFTDPVGVGALQGEVVAFDGETLTVTGLFTPGDTLQFRPGTRVVALAEDALDDATKMPADLLGEMKSELHNSISDARNAIDDIESAIDDLKT